MRRYALLVIVLALPVVAGAQSPAPVPASDGIMRTFEDFADVFGGRLVAAFDAIPAAQYDFHPKPMQQSIGYIAQHLEGANYALCARLGGPAHPTTAKDSLSDSVKQHWPKDTLVARLRSSLRYCDAALERMTKLETQRQARTLLAFETDLAEHYSQLSGYMRLLDLVPPSALPPRPRASITLPTSALAPYVGVYQFDESRQLDITMRDDVLWIRSTGGATVRLWAESGRDFFIREIDAQVTFAPDASGTVTGLVVHQYGRDQVAPRVR